MRTKKLSTRVAIDYFLVFLLISLSGNPFFKTDQFLIFGFLLSLSVFIYRKKKFSNSSLIFFSLFVLVTILQVIKFDYFPIVTYGGVYLKVLTAYFIVKILNFRFIYAFVKIFYFISIISIIFYILINISNNIFYPFSIDTSIDSLYPRYSVYGVFAFIKGFELRNCGPFWEPGAYGGYLVLALFFNFFSNFKNKKRFQLVLLIALLTTLSTTAYTCAIIFYFLTIKKAIKFRVIKYSFYCLFAFGIYFAFTSFGFLGKKIEYQISKINDYDATSDGSSRALSLIKDLSDIRGHELIGRGFNEKTRFKISKENQIRTFGLSDIAVKLGLPFFLLMMYMAYSSFNNYLIFMDYRDKYSFFSLFICFILILVSQSYFNYSLIWSFLFLKFTYTDKKIMYKLFG